MNKFIETIISEKSENRNTSFLSLIEGKQYKDVIDDLFELERFRQNETNLYFTVRSCMFLYAAFNYLVNKAKDIQPVGHIPYQGYSELLERNYNESIQLFYEELKTKGANITILSALSKAYYLLSFKILANQVRKSVRSSKGNVWMFRGGYRHDHAIRIHKQLLTKENNSLLFPILKETTAVRMDLSHSCWSDIFFLGMDYPQGARVINVSIDLGVYKRDTDIKPPIQTYLRVISEPVIRLTSIDLNTTKDITSLHDLFNFGNDYLSLLKAGVISSGFIPPSFEGSNQELSEVLEVIVGKGMGVELVTSVNNIPKGSRLAVSTNLLGSIIACFMRATAQTQSLNGELTETEKRLVASRAILGEWLGGSGGGWQDSGGVWPGIKVIKAFESVHGDPEYGISKGCLLPKHEVLSEETLNNSFYQNLADSLVVFHGGMAQNVGPVLEMVTERYLLRSGNEWEARQESNRIFDLMIQSIKEGNIKKLAELTTQHWNGPLKTIIPWVTNKYTETIIEKAKNLMKEDFYGFLMMGGMSGGGMGIFVNPLKRDFFKEKLYEILQETKTELQHSLPFAMNPVIYNFNINRNGTIAELMKGNKALMPGKYYLISASNMVEKELPKLSELRKAEFDYYTEQCADTIESHHLLRTLVSSLFKVTASVSKTEKQDEDSISIKIKQQNGFDLKQHEMLRESMIKGKVGLFRNRLSNDTIIEDVKNIEIEHYSTHQKYLEIARQALENNQVGVLTLAAGVGSRWTKGAGVIKAINPFVQLKGMHRNFLEIHLLKSQKTASVYKTKVPHVIATSYLTGQYIEEYLEKVQNHRFSGLVYVSKGKSIGQRFIPMVRDLHFLWEEMPEEILDEQKQKVRESARGALIDWAKTKGEGSDYIDNIAKQRLSPMGHWYEVSNLIKNGTLFKMLQETPTLKTLLLHNIDTLGASIDPYLLGIHLSQKNDLSFEVIPRIIDDRGGGLAKVNGSLRLLEGLAQPNESDEFRLSYYNTMTTWINIDALLMQFGLTRSMLNQPQEVLDEAIRKVAQKMPTYVTIKDVKYRWGHGQEDVYPVAQMEKLWSDMSSLSDLKIGYIAVDRMRGQQLKDPSQLDQWYFNGSKEYIENLMGI